MFGKTEIMFLEGSNKCYATLAQNSIYSKFSNIWHFLAHLLGPDDALDRIGNARSTVRHTHIEIRLSRTVCRENTFLGWDIGITVFLPSISKINKIPHLHFLHQNQLSRLRTYVQYEFASLECAHIFGIMMPWVVI